MDAMRVVTITKVEKVQILGDSNIVINWLNGENNI
jgi:hypothetical protein